MQISNVAINIFGDCKIKPEIKCVNKELCIPQKEYEKILKNSFGANLLDSSDIY